MPFYHKLGEIPHKRHTVFPKEERRHLLRAPDGEPRLHRASQSLLYTIRRRRTVRKTELLGSSTWERDPDRTLRHAPLLHAPPPERRARARSSTGCRSSTTATSRSPSPGRRTDDASSTATPRATRSSTSPRGAACSSPSSASCPYRKGDYLVMPRGILHRYRLGRRGRRSTSSIESAGYVRTPERYRNEHGQLLEHSPFCERDIRAAAELPVHDEKGEFEMIVKKANALHRVVLDHHPFDAVGLGRLLLPVGLQHRGLRADRRPHPPAAARAPDLRGGRLRRLLLRSPPLRLPPGGDPGPLQPLQRHVRRGALLLQRRVHEPEGDRVRVDHPAPGRAAPRPAPGQDRGVDRQEGDERARRDDRHLPPRSSVAKAVLAVEDAGYGRSWLE